MRFILLLCAVLAAAACGGVLAAVSVPARAELLAENTALQPGARSWLGIHLAPEPGWHSYWRNPGDSGLATSVQWTLPAGYSAGEIVWAAPERIEVGGIVNYGYAGDVLLLVPVQVPAGAPAGAPATLAGKVSFLVCREVCIPVSARVSLALPVTGGAARADATHAAAFARARQQVPSPLPAAARAQFDVRGHALVLQVALSGAMLRTPLFFPADNALVDHSAKVRLDTRGDTLQLTLPLGSHFTSAPARFDGVLEGAGAGGERVAWQLSAARAAITPIVASVTAPAPAGAVALARAVLLALLGGALLNFMPCVFPVLSIKALALLRDGAGRAQSLSYSAGVLTSMLVLAILLLALRGAGHALGWGFQLQSPVFVGALAYLLFAMGLSLSGVVEFGARFMGTGQSLAQAGGHTGSFFTGVLAVVVATPCTAPFMAPALSFALAQPALIAVVVMLALGSGLAAPFLLLAAAPAAVRWLPRPGAWMETFRQLMAFPLYASSVWLLWVVGRQIGVDGLTWTLLGALVLALGLWARGRWPLRPLSGVAAALCIVVAAGALATLPRHGDQAMEARAPAAAGTPGTQPYSESRLGELRAQHRTVFVNFTADWCITCKVNERVALQAPQVRRSFQLHDVAWLVADWTNGDPEITRALARFGRPGVPLYLIYPAGAEPRVLPQILTPGMLTAALDPGDLPAPQAAR